jgi:hypothetical protein
LQSVLSLAPSSLAAKWIACQSWSADKHGRKADPFRLLSQSPRGFRMSWWLTYHRWRTPPRDARLEIAGNIGQATLENIRHVLEQDPLAPIYASIDSPGGDPFEAMRCGHCARIGRQCTPTSPRAVAAPRCWFWRPPTSTASPIARFQVHNAEYALPRIGWHTAAVMRDGAADLAAVDEEIVAILALRCTRYPHWQLRADVQDEIALDASQAWLHACSRNHGHDVAAPFGRAPSPMGEIFPTAHGADHTTRPKEREKCRIASSRRRLPSRSLTLTTFGWRSTGSSLPPSAGSTRPKRGSARSIGASMRLRPRCIGAKELENGENSVRTVRLAHHHCAR